MARYAVTLVTEASFTVEVDAEDEANALEMAFNQVPVALCHQEPVDIGDWGLYEDDPELNKLGMRSAQLIEENN